MESDRTDSRMNLDRTEPRPIQKQRRPTNRSGPWMTNGLDWTNSIGSIRLGLESVGPGRYRSGPDRGCPYLDEAMKEAATSNTTASEDLQHHHKPLKSARNRTMKDASRRE